MTFFSDSILSFYFNLKPFPLPSGVEVLNPYLNQDARRATTQFYHKFYHDADERIFIIGINAGRFGGGITGIPFTDPVRLKEECCIEHPFPLKPELSSGFIYRMIRTYGGPEKFFKKYFLTAICPLGFTFQGKNMNYYDSHDLLAAALPFIRESLPQQVKAGAVTTRCFCLGEGSNYRYLKQLNDELSLFKDITPLPHPRWIMQYKRKFLDQYIQRYIDAFA